MVKISLKNAEHAKKGLEDILDSNLANKLGNVNKIAESKIHDGLDGLTKLYTKPGEIVEGIKKYVMDNDVIKKLSNKVKDSPKALKELSNLVSQYSKGLVETPGKFRRYLTQYNIGELFSGVKNQLKGTTGVDGSVFSKGMEYLPKLKDLVYSVPGRVYGYLGGIGDIAGRAFTLGIPSLSTGFYSLYKKAASKGGEYTGKILKGLFKKGAKSFWELFLNMARPFLYPIGGILGGYVVYRIIKRLIRRKNKFVDQGELEKKLSHDDLEELSNSLKKRRRAKLAPAT
jgi:hypothetical protein